MAKMHDANESKPPMMRDRMVSVEVKYDEIPNGARITLTPTDPAQLEELREQVRAHAERMNKGYCPMMQGMMGGMKKAEPTPNDDNHDSHHPQ